MHDLGTVLWKESAEFAGNRRFLRTFGFAVLIMGLLPVLSRQTAAAGASGAALTMFVSLLYALFSGVIVVAQTAPDLVLHERSGRTLEYLLATRLSDAAIFAGKVIVGAAVGYCSSLLTVLIQLLAVNLRGGGGAWTWYYLAEPWGRLLVFAAPAALAVYIATVGTFVALRVGDQRAAYMVTMLSVALLAVPFLLHILTLQFTMSWIAHAVIVLAGLALVLVAVGVRLFRREMLVLYLQE